METSQPLHADSTDWPRRVSDQSASSAILITPKPYKLVAGTKSGCCEAHLQRQGRNVDMGALELDQGAWVPCSYSYQMLQVSARSASALSKAFTTLITTKPVS